MQIFTNLSMLLDVPWPQAFLGFLDVFNFVNLDFLPWQSIGCAATWTFLTKLTLIALVPPAIFAALILFYLFPLWVLDKRDMADSDRYRIKRQVSRIKFWKLTLFTLFLIYPYVSANSFKFFVCRSVNGVSYFEQVGGSVCA